MAFKHTAPHHKAWLVGRYDASIWSALLKAELQVINESLCDSFIAAFVLETFMHNALTSLNNRQFYLALFGRQPALFPSLEGGYHCEVDTDGQDNLARAREMTAVANIEITATHRVARGDKGKMAVVQQRAEHRPGDLVDIWYDPPNKDTPGRRGPAQIATVNEG